MTREDIVIKLDIILPSIEDGVITNSNSVRCGAIDLQKNLEYYIVRCIAVNAFYFYIVLSKSEIFPEVAIEELAFVMNSLPGVIVHPSRPMVKVDNNSGRNTRYVHEDFIKATQSSYEEYIKKGK